MTTYKIFEKQNLQSIRDHSHVFEGSLIAAKRFASRNKAFQGTVLVIEDEEGFVCYKENGKWTNA